MPTGKQTKLKTTTKKGSDTKLENKKRSSKPTASKTSRQNNTIKPKLIFSLDEEGRLLIEKFYKWTKFVGIMNIILGIIYCLTIFVFSIPTVMIGVITILMGSKLTIAADHLRYAKDNKDDDSFQIALEQLSVYFVINGVLFILTLVFVMMLLLLASMFAGIFMEILNELRFFDSSLSA